ncbi:hypothetical protein RMCBS344292_05787 [Rhizopus microsporus]|nr:hypothetical protein RMCBS344292_05787 [Rhizopus microsporus]
MFISDFSYLQRVALEIYMLAFLASRVWATDRFRCLHPKRIIHGELRSVITVIYFLVALMQMTWDVISTWIKYSEKFVQIPNTTMIISKPFDYWTPQHQYIAMVNKPMCNIYLYTYFI